MATRKIPHETVKALFSYDPRTGRLSWAKPHGRWGHLPAGREAGGLNDQGYREVRVHGKLYPVHRLVWFWVHGDWPSMGLDHINGVRHDNRLSNLRLASAALNGQNRKAAQANSRLGILGVQLHKPGVYRARIKAEGKHVHLGLFTTAEDAHAAYLQAKDVYHPGAYK